MIWVFVFVGIALAGLIMGICYAVWLAHKASDLFSEIVVLADRAGRLADLLSQLQPPEETVVGDLLPAVPAPQPGRARRRARRMAAGASASPYL